MDNSILCNVSDFSCHRQLGVAQWALRISKVQWKPFLLATQLDIVYGSETTCRPMNLVCWIEFFKLRDFHWRFHLDWPLGRDRSEKKIAEWRGQRFRKEMVRLTVPSQGWAAGKFVNKLEKESKACPHFQRCIDGRVWLNGVYIRIRSWKYVRLPELERSRVKLEVECDVICNNSFRSSSHSNYFMFWLGNSGLVRVNKKKI